MSQDYQTHQLNIEEDNLIRPIRTRYNTHTHTCNTRQPKPQLKSSSCSSVIPSHNLRNVMCLTHILSHNSRDAFWATTQGTPASRPSKYHQSLVDHAHPKQAKHKYGLCIIAWGYSWVTRWNAPPNRLAGDTCCQAPSVVVATILQVSLGGTTLTARHHAFQASSDIIAITWRCQHYC